jgi:RNA polymerase sigma-70 factor (ECF subfamily)
VPYEQQVGVAPAAVLALERADERERVEAALRALPDHQRVPLVLFHFEEASYEEIAGMLSITVAKVKTDIHRGRETLRKALAETTRHGSR